MGKSAQGCRLGALSPAGISMPFYQVCSLQFAGVTCTAFHLPLFLSHSTFSLSFQIPQRNETRMKLGFILVKRSN